ncbi:MAG: DUF4340 domain-containing protein [Anaerolineae bacterium]|jgi:hypothetical protein
MNRLNRILVGILALQLVLAVVVFWPRSASSGEGTESLFPGVEADQIQEITLTDAQGTAITLAKRDGSWVLPDADDYPADPELVEPLVDGLAALNTDRLVTQTSASHERLQVAEDDFQRRIDFQMADGSTHRVYLGSAPSYGVAHVRADGQDEVYLTSDLSAQDAGVQASSWVDTSYFSVPQEEVVTVTVENAQGTLEFQKEGESWTLVGLAPDDTLNEGMARSFVNRAISISLLRPLGREELDAYGMQEPNAVVTIRAQAEGEDATERTYTLQVGAQDPEDSGYVVKSSESPYYVQVREFSVQDIVEKGYEDFIEVPPTPTPEELPEATPSP